MSNLNCRMQAVWIGGITFLLASVVSAPGQSVSDNRVAELMKEAMTLIQNTQTEVQAPTQEGTDLTLDEAIQQALEENLDIAVERINPQVADLDVAQVRAAYTPTVSMTIGQNNQIQLPRTQLVGGTHAQNDQKNYNAGLTKALPWFGGTASVSWNNSRVFNTASFQNYNPQFITGLTVNYVQPLLRNFRIDLTRQQLEVSTIDRRIADVELRSVIANTVANVKNAYWDLLYTIHAVQVARTSLQLAEKLVEDNKTRVEIGTMAPLDVVEAESEAATRRQALVEAQANRQTAELALKRLIVGSTEDPLWSATLNPVDLPPGNPEPIDLEAAVRNALQNRTDLMQAREQLQRRNVSIRYMRNQALPTVDLGVSYGLQGIGGTYFERQGLGGSISKVVPGGYGDALSLITDREYPLWAVSATLSYPIGTSIAEATHARAKLEYQQAQAQLKQLELQAVTEVTNAALQVESNLQSFRAGRAARELAQKRLEAEQSKFEVGMSTSFFVVQAQRDFADAQIAELRAVLDYMRALVNFYRLQETPTSRGTIGVSTSGTVSTSGGGRSAGTTGTGATGGSP